MGTIDTIDRITKLATQRARGVITPEEFRREVVEAINDDRNAILEAYGLNGRRGNYPGGPILVYIERRYSQDVQRDLLVPLRWPEGSVDPTTVATYVLTGYPDDQLSGEPQWGEVFLEAAGQLLAIRAECRLTGEEAAKVVGALLDHHGIPEDLRQLGFVALLGDAEEREEALDELDELSS